MKRMQWILTAVLVFQIVLSAVVFWPRSTAGSSAPLFPNLQAGDITALTLQNSSATLTLRKVNDGWVVPDADDYPALADKITPVLEKLAQLNTGRLVARTAASHKQLQVAADNYALKLSFETITETQTIYFGTSSGANATHIRVDGHDEVYLASDLNIWELSPTASAWINTTYLTVSVSALTQVTVENAQGKVTLVQDQTFWRLPGANLDQVPDQTKISSLLNQLAALPLTTPLGKEAKPEYGLDQPAAVITLTTQDKTITLKVGAKDAQGYAVSSSESPYYVRVAEYLLQSWVNATLDSFTQTPTPTPTPLAVETPVSVPTTEMTPTQALTPTTELTGTQVLTPTVTP